MAYKIAIDPGHGGQDFGAMYEERKEKDDNLDLALAVGQLLEDQGVDVVYTRVEDVYNTPFEKATMGNNADADLFVSFHRNAAVQPGSGKGAEVLVYQDANLPATVARSILEGMEAAGFQNNGVTERKDLVVLRRTRMPAVLLEVGFLDNPEDNAKFDDNFEMLAQEIASGILKAIPTSGGQTQAADPPADTRETTDSFPVKTGQREIWYPGQNPFSQNGTGQNGTGLNGTGQQPPASDPLYRVQTGAYREKRYAENMRNELTAEGFPAFLLYQDGYYKVQVGAFAVLENAIRMERVLREYGYNTYITT